MIFWFQLAFYPKDATFFLFCQKYSGDGSELMGQNILV
jgi:hypothetical protein